ncbi:unnamed protein product [Linum trigynum]|uniref:Uncharacterized protein n=1 Tax=Linum trigynum TaxID=586398 RepID=A0AAV2D8B3_9ROSI
MTAIVTIRVSVQVVGTRNEIIVLPVESIGKIGPNPVEVVAEPDIDSKPQQLQQQTTVSARDSAVNQW